MQADTGALVRLVPSSLGFNAKTLTQEQGTRNELPERVSDDPGVTMRFHQSAAHCAGV